MIIFLITILTSLALDSLELSKFVMNRCNTSQNPTRIYMGFGIMIIIKIICVSCFNMEIVEYCSYQVKVPFLIPFLIYGLTPLFQIPQFVYNYASCNHINKKFSVDDASNILLATLILISIFVFYKIIKIIFDIFSIEVDAMDGPRVRKIVNIIKVTIYILIMLAFNLMMMTIFFSQITFFLPAFFFDIYVWVYFILLIIISSYLKNKKKDSKNETKKMQPSNTAKSGVINIGEQLSHN